MKQPLLLLVALVTICTMACKKNTNTYTPPATLTGTWELFRLEGNFIKYFAPNTGNLLKLNTDSTYQLFSADTLAKSGTYSLAYNDTTAPYTTGTLIPAGKYTTRIIYDGNTTAQKVYLDITGNNLTLVSGNFQFDGGSFTYYTKK